MKVGLVVVVGFLCSLILLGLMLAPLAGQPSGYNPWLDSNDDGIIDVLDLQALGAAYGSSGAPLNVPMALEYDSGWLDISGMQGQNVTVTHNLNLATDFVQTVYGKTLPESEVHQTCFVGTGYARGWNETYDSGLKTVALMNVARSVVQTSDGGYAMAGFTRNSTNKRLFWLVKTDSAGNHLWNKTYGGTNEGVAYSLVQTDDGGYALAGYTNSLTTSYTAAWLVKTDSAGNHQWNKTYVGADPWLYDEAYSLVHTADGGYAIAGITQSLGLNDFWLVKVDASGNMQWNKTYGGPLGSEDCPYSLVETSDGGYALAGYTSVNYALDDYGILLVKTDVSGNQQWNRTYDWGPTFDCAYSLVQTGDGGYAMAGCANSTSADAFYFPLGGSAPTYSDYWLVKTDSAGNMQWNKKYGDEGYPYEVAYSMVMTSDGGFAIAGYDFQPPGAILGWLVKTDAFGLCDREVIEFGLAIIETTANTLTLYRGKIDPYWNYVRVRIWIAKENP